MTSQKTAKLNQLFQRWPKGTVATQTWLNQLGISSKLANWHVGSGWLNRFGARAFKQPGDQVGWQGGLYALQTQLKMTVHIGGLHWSCRGGPISYLLGPRRRFFS